MTQVDSSCLCGEGYVDGTCCGWKPVVKSELEIRRINGDWLTVKVSDDLFIDLSTSKRDKRDWIISKRKDVFLEQDKGFISCWVKKSWSLAEMKAELLDIAKGVKLDW